MCCLTDPLQAVVVHADVLSWLLGAAAGADVEGRWLAVVTQGSRSCFHGDRSNFRAGVMLLTSSVASICAVGRFCAADGAHAWLSMTASSELLTVLGESAGVTFVSTGPRLVGALGVPAAQPQERPRPGFPARGPLAGHQVFHTLSERPASISTRLSGVGRRCGVHQFVSRVITSSAVLPVWVALSTRPPLVTGSAANDAFPVEVAVVHEHSPFAEWSPPAARTADVLDVDEPVGLTRVSSGARPSPRGPRALPIPTATHRRHGAGSGNNCAPATKPSYVGARRTT